MSGVRFAFYGRTSTADYQDPVSSRAWQVEIAKSVIAGRGEVVVEFFDVGWSREVAWERRPRAAALLAAARDPRRPFDAVVVGEFERAFSARQFLAVAETLARHGVQVWLPEADGPVDIADPVHCALVTVLGAKAKHEVVRARHRTLAAMRAQTVVQGRFLGGRPPYGYRLVDAGPHPNRAQAAWGKRLHRLDPDPATATHVRWMFARRLQGRSLAGIARELNDRGVLCPSQDDPGRNRNRVGGRWSVTTVKTILANPRYTGREVWNRRQAAGGTGRATVIGEAVVSNMLTHPALVTEKDFVAAQQRLVSASADRRLGAVQRPRPDPHFRAYTLAPGWPIELEVHCVDGSVALVRGTIDRVPWLAGDTAQRVVIVEAVARPLLADPPRAQRRGSGVMDEPEREWRPGEQDPRRPCPTARWCAARILRVDELAPCRSCPSMTW